MATLISQDELYHHGILGQKWGIRRYQNADGTRTPEGKKRRDELEGGKSNTKNHSGKKIAKRIAVAATAAATIAVGVKVLSNLMDAKVPKEFFDVGDLSSRHHSGPTAIDTAKNVLIPSHKNTPISKLTQ